MLGKGKKEKGKVKGEKDLAKEEGIGNIQDSIFLESESG